MEPWLPFVLYLAPILILLVQPHLFTDAASQTKRLRAGSDMRTTEYLTSSSGTFVFGFCNFNPSLSPNQFLLAIWFNFDAPESTNKKVVWFLRDQTSNSMVIARKHTILTFTANGQLFLHDDQMLLWTNAKQFGSDLVLQDSGNLQLLANGGAVLWQSFDYPSDTLLPGQSMTNQPERYLQSKNTDADFSPGHFTMMVQDDGNIFLYMRDPDLPIDARDLYWATETNEIGMVQTLFFSDSGTLYYNLSRVANGSVMHSLTALRPPDSAERYYQYTALDPDGTVRIYVRSKNNTDGSSHTLWEVLSQFPVVGCSRRTMYSSQGLRILTHKELYRATNGFEELLGKGGFGEVYKVKKLITSEEYSEKDFENEVQSIGWIHHKNLVRMIRYCKEGAHRMLVFEYMQGGTLADFIFRLERPCWSCLAETAIGIAKGLEYLHEGCKSKIIHCDIKPGNILFDDHHIAKITDLGIAKLLGDQRTQHTVTTIAGTRPYVAPEWFDGGGKVTSKVDVYSFGVVLLEMICCKKAAGDWQPDNQGPSTMFSLRAWAESLIRSGRTELLVQGESEALADMKSVETFTRVAIWCLQKDPSIRPTMHKVVQMLEGVIKVDPLPALQGFQASLQYSPRVVRSITPAAWCMPCRSNNNLMLYSVKTTSLWKQICYFLFGC
ncbi:G-type lectin S-receptor-like serine/threonine-protein kinase RLK1 [Panicum miliaceum]|uniref:non-specific serine/threonine protein kinase n=1 Tax=Panicum miliaceum TaxID=4540 RepID=A0A3L6PFD3_PANMI|nr:G-type lectin S-receptor-like serine/threonine-protein kinase RLK1 [Panicum miliaceum]